MTKQTTYDADFYLWTRQQAALLRQGRLQAVDAAHLAEEIESMGKSDRRALGSHLRSILLHLLKWRHQPDRRGASWESSIRNGRDEVEEILADSPSLNAQLVDSLETEYRRARRIAASETGLPMNTFSDQCPFTVEQVLDAEYWPD